MIELDFMAMNKLMYRLLGYNWSMFDNLAPILLRDFNATLLITRDAEDWPTSIQIHFSSSEDLVAFKLWYL